MSGTAKLGAVRPVSKVGAPRWDEPSPGCNTRFRTALSAVAGHTGDRPEAVLTASVSRAVQAEGPAVCRLVRTLVVGPDELVEDPQDPL